jgi:hypothetical protein
MPAKAFSSYSKTVLRIVCLSIPILTLFAGTILACSLVVSWWQDAPLLSAATWLPSTICGLAVWLFVTVIHLKKETAILPVADVPAFRQKVRTELVDLGYDALQLSPTTVLFRPPFASYLLGGWISLNVENGYARVIGPKVRLERLLRRLRLGSFVAKDHKALTSMAIRQGKHLVRRVQISFRVKRDEWQGVQEEVLRALAREGAELVCDLNVLAQSDVGIPTSVIEGPIRNWLRERQIKAIIHKEYLQPTTKQTGESKEWHSVSEIDLGDPLSIADSNTPRDLAAVGSGA